MRSDGLLRYELYIGRLVWRRRINVKDPISGARVRHDNRPVDHLVIEVPHLRIIDDELWQRVQTRLKRDAAPVHEGPDGARPALWVRRRPRHLLSGKAFCGVCGRPLSRSVEITWAARRRCMALAVTAGLSGARCCKIG